jgi:(2Fe-2S) ferredoxin
MAYYNNHLFICTNQKDGKECCANHNAAEIVVYAKQRAKDLGLTKSVGFRISSSGCMGRCAEGPVMVLYPAGVWYTYKNKQDVDQLLSAVAAGETPAGDLALL